MRGHSRWVREREREREIVWLLVSWASKDFVRGDINLVAHCYPSADKWLHTGPSLCTHLSVCVAVPLDQTFFLSKSPIFSLPPPTNLSSFSLCLCLSFSLCVSLPPLKRDKWLPPFRHITAHHYRTSGPLGHYVTHIHTQTHTNTHCIPQHNQMTTK